MKLTRILCVALCALFGSIATQHLFAQPISGGVYTLVCKTSGLALDNEGSTSAGNGLWQWALQGGNTNQQWQINQLPDGRYDIVCLTSGMALDSANGFSNGTNVIQSAVVPHSVDQEWTITQLSNGYYTLVSAANGLALDNNNGTSNGSNVWQWAPQNGNTNQMWQLNLVMQLPIASGGIYTLNCKTGGMNLDNSGSGSAGNTVYQWSAGLANTNQEWQINVLPSGRYSLTCLTSGMNLDNGGSSNNGATVSQWYPQAATNTNQQWTITSSGSGYYTLVCQTSGLALDNSGATQNGGSVWQWTPQSGNTNQQWAINPVQIGANTPFISYEAESGVLGGSAKVVALTSPPTTQFSSPQLEASGHAYVNLGNTGDSVTWTNNTGKSITAINVRYSIPDSTSGGGISSTLDLYVNGSFRQALPVNSLQTWMYESSSNYNGMNQSPSAGSAHVFWDEARAFISGAAVAPGSTITLQKDSSNSAQYYNVDVVDLETPPAPISQPANSLSIASYGAQANNPSFDNTAAIQNCFNAAASSGQVVWIPQGTFYLTSGSVLFSNGINVQGAGPWYSTILDASPSTNWQNLNLFQPTSSSFSNLCVDSLTSGTGATTAAGRSAFLAYGNGWTLNNVWSRHMMLTWGTGNNITVENCRVNNSMGDGINLNNTSGTAANNVMAYNNFSRGNGDDGLALNCTNTSAPIMMYATYVDNTCVAEWWANEIGIYAGVSGVVNNNLALDTIKEQGISVGTFDGQYYLQNCSVSGNVVIRGGSYGYALHEPAMCLGQFGNSSDITSVNCFGNMFTDSMFDSIDISAGTNLAVAGNSIIAPGLDGISISSSATGNASFTCNTVEAVASGNTAFLNSAPAGSFSVAKTNNNGF